MNMPAKARQTTPRLSLEMRDFCQISRTMARDTGIALPAHKLPLVQSRLLKRLKALGLQDFHTYCAFVASPEGQQERVKMFSVLTTNVTGFFREPHHFETLKSHVAPRLAASLRAGKSVRIWSAGCSSGEEPYSLALTFLDVIPDLARLDFKILATDIDPEILKTALRGSYSSADLGPMPHHLRRRYFNQPDTRMDAHHICQSARNLISFKQLNLIEEWPMTRRFDVIMCRNVVIYFGDATKTQIWSKMLTHLRDDGVLMTGHSERLSGPAASRLKLVATTTYCQNQFSEFPNRAIPCF